MAQSAHPRPDTSDMPAVHKVFKSSLASGGDFIGSAAGSDTRRALIASYYKNLMAFLQAHHDGEDDIVLAPLMERAPEHRALVERSSDQHSQVVELMAKVRENVGLWEEAGDAGAQEVVRSLQALDEALTPHLIDEEAEILPLVSEYLTAEEWGTLGAYCLGKFEGDKVWLVLGLVRENFTQEQRDGMLEHMPASALQWWVAEGEPSFKAFMAQVRQTA